MGNSRRVWVWFGGLLLGLVAALPVAQAQSVVPQHFPPAAPVRYDETVSTGQRGIHERDGFMLRLSGGVGGGFARLLEPQGAGRARVRNRALALLGAISAGGGVRGPWALHADLLWLVLPRVRTRGGPGEEARRVRDMALSLGPGVTRFLPHDTFLSASVGLALGVEDRDGERPVQTNPGPLVSLALGRTFWVREQWSAGVGLRACYADLRTRFKFDPGRMRVFAAALTAVVSFH